MRNITTLFLLIMIKKALMVFFPIKTGTSLLLSLKMPKPMSLLIFGMDSKEKKEISYGLF